jgi:GT2 family glycosyltransferase
VTTVPVFSVIVPTYRRPERLAACLRALAALDYPSDRFEVIVVDDGGGATTDGAPAGLDVTLLSQPHAGPAAARNTGAARARGEYLAFTDDDCAPDAGWLRALAEHASPGADQLIGGYTVNALADNPYSAATQLLLDYLYEWQAGHADEDGFFASNNLAAPTALFRARGGFDTGFPLAAGEDRELCYRWVRSGGRLVYAPRAVVRHAHHLTLRSFWRQHVNYGRGARRFHLRRTGDLSAGRSPTFYTNLVTCPLTRVRGSRRLTLTALLALTQLATATGYWRERLRE